MGISYNVNRYIRCLFNTKLAGGVKGVITAGEGTIRAG